MCTAFVDSVMEIGACALSEHDKRHLLYSAATTQSTMDYSRKAVEDDVVDSPPSRGIVPLPISSPFLCGVEEQDNPPSRDTETLMAHNTV